MSMLGLVLLPLKDTFIQPNRKLYSCLLHGIYFYDREAFFVALRLIDWFGNAYLKFSFASCSG